MNLGIIGAGSIGQALARLGVAAGHSVMISNSRGPDTLMELASEIGCTAGTSRAAAEFGDLVVVTVPFKKVFQIDPEILDGKVVIDTNNYYPGRDGRFAELDNYATTTSSMVQSHFPGAKVVKAFNAILATDLASESINATRGRALPIAGEDETSKRLVAELHQQFGLQVVDTGSLAESWRFERAKPAYCIPMDSPRLRDALKQAQRDVELPHGSWRR